MTGATIKIYQSLDGHRELIRTFHIENKSAKPLTGARALKILVAQFPELGHVHVLSKTEQGWSYSRAIEPKPNCSFHYKWEHYYVSQVP